MEGTKTRLVALTTEDNPFDPLEQFDEWYQFDESHGYHTSSYLDRMVADSQDLSPSIQTKLIEDAIDEIVDLNITGNYKKIIKEI